MNDVEVRFYDRQTGERLPFNPDDLLDVKWSLTEAGGVDSITARLARPFDDLDFKPAPGCIVEAVVLSDPIPAGAIEPHPRARGILSQPEATLDLTETRTLLAYGLMEDMNHVPLDGTMPEPGGADLARFAAKTVIEYLKERSWLSDDNSKPARLRYLLDVQDTGVSRERLDLSESDCRKALDELAAQSPGLIVWGWRVDKATGANLFTFRPRTQVIEHQLAVGENVKFVSRPLELSRVLNAGRFKGGTSLWPNLLAAAVEGNTSFELIDLRGASEGNLVSNSYFAEGSGGTNVTNWDFLSGATSKTASLTEGPAFRGSRMAELDNAGELIGQSRTGISAKLINGNTLLYEAEVRLEQGTHTREGVMRLRFLDSLGNTLTSAADVPVKPVSGFWGYQARGAARIPPLAHGYRIEIEATSGAGGIIIGEVRVWDRDKLYARGWETVKYGGADFTKIDPAYNEYWPGHWGRKCIRVAGTFTDADGQDGHLQPIGQAMFSVSPNQTVKFVARMKRTPGMTTSGKMLLEVHGRKDNGEGTTNVKQEIAANALTDDWIEFVATYTASSDTTRATAWITFRENTDCLIDCVQVRDGGAPMDGLNYEFITGASWERRVLAEMICDAGTEAASSFSTHERRERYVGNPTLTQWDAAAQAWIKAFLTKMGALTSRARVDLLHEAQRVIDPLDGSQVRLSGLEMSATGKVAVPDSWPVRVEYSAAGLTLSVSISLGDEPPSLARQIGYSPDGSGSVSSGGSAVTSGGAASGGLPPSGGSSATDHGALSGLADDDHLQYLTTARGDARYPLIGHNHDSAYSPINHNHDAAYAPIATQTEVTDARTRDAVGAFAATSFLSLKAHLASLWSYVEPLWSKRTADPTAQADGKVLTTSGGKAVWSAGLVSGSTITTDLQSGDALDEPVQGNLFAWVYTDAAVLEHDVHNVGDYSIQIIKNAKTSGDIAVKAYGSYFAFDEAPITLTPGQSCTIVKVRDVNSGGPTVHRYYKVS